MAEVYLTDDAKADLARLDRSVQARIVKKLRILEQSPEYGKPLRDELSMFRRLVVGDRDWRIVYTLASSDVVVVWCIGKRADSEVYEEAARRVGSLAPGELQDQMRTILQMMGGLVDPESASSRQPRRQERRRHRRQGGQRRT